MTDETPDPEDTAVAGVAEDDESTQTTADVPPDVVEEVERLTRLARDAVDDAEAEACRARRDELLAEYDYTTRVREDDAHDTLVLHPEEWLEGGVAQLEAIDDLDRGIERPLGGSGDGEDWETVAERNRAIADAVAAEHGEVHGETAAALAEFMHNHYAKPIDSATDDEITEFVTEYFPRNAWPSDEQRDRVDRSVALTLEVAETF